MEDFYCINFDCMCLQNNADATADPRIRGVKTSREADRNYGQDLAVAAAYDVETFLEISIYSQKRTPGSPSHLSRQQASTSLNEAQHTPVSGAFQQAIACANQKLL